MTSIRVLGFGLECLLFQCLSSLCLFVKGRHQLAMTLPIRVLGIVSVILFLQLFFSVFPSPFLASILHFETDLVRSFLLKFVL